MTVQEIEFKLKPIHYKIVTDPHRFIVAITGRRFFKTGMALAKIAQHITQPVKNVRTGEPLLPDIGYYAPTYSQAKEIFWDRAKTVLAPLIAPGGINEQDLAIRFRGNMGRLRLYGTDQNAEKLRGRYKSLVINDEFAYHRPGIYEIVVRPMLSDTKGEAWFLSSPNGRNHAFKYFERGISDEEDIISYHYTSVEGGYITEEEVQAARRDMTENKWRQEYLAEFIGMEGRVVLDWTYANTDLDIDYMPNQVIYLSCDFNIDPMCWVLAHRINGEYLYFDELVMRNTNVEKAALEVANRYRQHKAGIIITGDSSGKNRNVLMTDLGATAYPIIKSTLEDYAKIPKIEINIRSANPVIQERIDGFNRLVYSGDGVRRVRVNPYKCPKIVFAMENCRYIEGSSIIYQPSMSDIKNDPDSIYQNHVFDAVSYLTERFDPIPKTIRGKNDEQVVTSIPYRTKRKY